MESQLWGEGEDFIFLHWPVWRSGGDFISICRHLNTLGKLIVALLSDLTDKHMPFFSACRQNIEWSRSLLVPSILWDAWWPSPAHMLWATVINKAEGSQKISLQGQMGVGVPSFDGQRRSAGGITCTHLPNRLRPGEPLDGEIPLSYFLQVAHNLAFGGVTRTCSIRIFGWNWEMRLDEARCSNNACYL